MQTLFNDLIHLLWLIKIIYIYIYVIIINIIIILAKSIIIIQLIFYEDSLRLALGYIIIL